MEARRGKKELFLKREGRKGRMQQYVLQVLSKYIAETLQ
jgi:hypothetical protein